MSSNDDLTASGVAGEVTDAEPHAAASNPQLRSASRAEVTELLSTDRFAQLVGVVESVEVDFKAECNLNEPRGRRDLMADLASFANTSGGILVIGAPAAKHPDEQIEFCSRVTGVPPGSITAERVQALLRQHTFPPVNVDVRSYRGHSTEREVEIEVVAISARASIESDRPVLVDRFVSGDDEKVPHAVGWPTRHGDVTHWESAARLQQLANTGRRPGWQSPAAVLEPGTALDLDEVLDALPGWDAWGRLVITLTPRHSGTIDDFYGTFRVKASQWRGSRGDMGFNLGIWPYNGFAPRRGHLVCDTSRTYVSVASHGAVVAAAIASPDFLAWAQHQGQPPSKLTVVRINPYPLVEFTFEAIRFAYELVGPAASVDGWRVVGRLEHAQDRVPMALAGTGPIHMHFERAAVTANEIEGRIDSSGDVGLDAFRLLEDLLGQAFSLGRDQIPLATDGRINPTTWGRSA